jgi:PilZ domain
MSEATTIGGLPGYAIARRWQRYEVDVPVRVIVCTAEMTKIFDGRGVSLSEGGMALFAGAELRPGDQVAVELTPAYSAHPIRVDATIRNRIGYHYGAEFLIASETQKQRVEELRRHLPTLVAVAGSAPGR